MFSLQREILDIVHRARILQREKRERKQMTLPVNKLILTVTPPYIAELGEGLLMQSVVECAGCMFSTQLISPCLESVFL